MRYEGGTGQREREREKERSTLAAVQPLKCHPDEASNQLEHSTSSAHTRTLTLLQSCEKMLTAIMGALNNLFKSN